MASWVCFAPRSMPSSGIMEPTFSRARTGAAGCMAIPAGFGARPDFWTTGSATGPMSGCRPNPIRLPSTGVDQPSSGRKSGRRPRNCCWAGDWMPTPAGGSSTSACPALTRDAPSSAGSGLREPGAIRRGMVCYAGDDTTDEYAFEALEGRAMTIVVGKRARGAAFRTSSPASLTSWLRRLASERKSTKGLRQVPSTEYRGRG